MYQYTHLLAIVVLFVASATAETCISADDPGKAVVQQSRPADARSAEQGAPCDYQPLVSFTEDLMLVHPDFNRRFDDRWRRFSCRRLAEHLVDASLVRQMACGPKSDACVREGLCEPVESSASREALVGYLMRLGQQPPGVEADVALCRATEASCEASSGCARQGRCTEKNGRCVVGGSADCARSVGCAADGLCALGDGGSCVAKTDAHCRQSGACKEEGKCTVGSEGRCQITDEAACAGSRACAERGRCGLSSGGYCVPKEPGHCAQSEACEREGKCTLGNQQCVVGSDADCRQSTACAREGHCSRIATRSPPSCGVGADRDCRSSQLCEEEGKCKASGGRCVEPQVARRSCRTQELCEEYGMYCEPVDGDCANPPGFDCAASKACDKLGLCDTVVVNGDVSCRASKPAHCRQSEVCKERGRCEVGDRKVYDAGDPIDEDVCVLSDAGCAQSELCEERGACSKISVMRAHYGDMPKCAPTRPEHCRRSRRCKEEGECALLPHPEEGEPVQYCGDG